MNKHLPVITLLLLTYGLSYPGTLNSQPQRMYNGNALMNAAQGNSFANTALSNLTNTSINKALMPKTDGALSLGGLSKKWKNLYLTGSVYLGNDAFLSGPQDNTFTGRGAGGLNNTGSSNTAYGFQALYSNNAGSLNTALGYGSLVSNTSGGSNTSVGYQTLYANTSGYGNTAMGRLALGYSTNSNYNTAIGYAAGDVASTYTNATFLGAYATTADNLFNVTAIGYGAQTTASNTITLGNTAVVEVNSTGTFVTTSDGRFKSDIKEGVPGLEFINKLRPVTYYYNIHKLNSYIKQESNTAQKEGFNGIKGGESAKADERPTAAARAIDESIKAKEAIKYSGFVAQEVEEAAREVNYDFSGVHKPANNKDVYGLSYAEFVVPLVKAVQELSRKNDEKDTKITDLQKQIDELKAMITEKFATTSISQQSPISSGALLQNIPNPVSGTTTISYSIPQQFASAKVILTDNAGKTLKEVSLTTGKGNVRIDVSALPAGSYHYSLYADGQLIGSKSMLVAK